MEPVHCRVLVYAGHKNICLLGAYVEGIKVHSLGAQSDVPVCYSV
jgi:hypothetical protein